MTTLYRPNLTVLLSCIALSFAVNLIADVSFIRGTLIVILLALAIDGISRGAEARRRAAVRDPRAGLL